MSLAHRVAEIDEEIAVLRVEIASLDAALRVARLEHAEGRTHLQREIMRRIEDRGRLRMSQEEMEERGADIVYLRSVGKTLREIGTAHDLSQERVRQILAQAERAEA